jgi:hypothetical protein
MKSKIDWTYINERLKFINNKPKSVTCTLFRAKSLPRPVFRAGIGVSIYMDVKKRWTTNWIHMQLESVFFSIKSDISTCNILIIFTVKIFILSRWIAFISKKLMKLFRTNETFYFDTYQCRNQCTAMNLIHVWKIQYFPKLNYLKIKDDYSSNEN